MGKRVLITLYLYVTCVLNWKRIVIKLTSFQLPPFAFYLSSLILIIKKTHSCSCVFSVALLRQCHRSVHTRWLKKLSNSRLPATDIVSCSDEGYIPMSLGLQHPIPSSRRKMLLLSGIDFPKCFFFFWLSKSHENMKSKKSVVFGFSLRMKLIDISLELLQFPGLPKIKTSSHICPF